MKVKVKNHNGNSTAGVMRFV